MKTLKLSELKRGCLYFDILLKKEVLVVDILDESIKVYKTVCTKYFSESTGLFNFDYPQDDQLTCIDYLK